MRRYLLVALLSAISGFSQTTRYGAGTFSKMCNQSDVADAKSCYGAYGDLQTDLNGNCSIASGSKTLSCSSSGFASTDVAKEAYVSGAGAAGRTLVTSISSFMDSRHLVLNDTASTSTETAKVLWGHDDTKALQNAYNSGPL